MTTRDIDTPRIHTFSVSGSADDRLRATATVRHFPPIVMDLPPSLGGGDAGPSPLERVLASLGGCLAGMAFVAARRMAFRYASLDYRFEGDLDLRGAAGAPGVCRHFSRVTGCVTVQTDESDERFRAFRDAVEDGCPVLNLLRDAGVDPDIRWVREPTPA